jgi:hypothetical protein
MATQIAIMPVALTCPSCPVCGTRMSLVSISPDEPVHDRRIYERARCLHEVTEKHPRSAPATAIQGSNRHSEVFEATYLTRAIDASRTPDLSSSRS